MHEIPVLVLHLNVAICLCVNEQQILHGDFVLLDLLSDHHVLFHDRQLQEHVYEYVNLL